MNNSTKIILAALLSLISVNALAITRTIECKSNSSNNEYLQINLRGGFARLFTCYDKRCEVDADIVKMENANLTNAGVTADEPLKYQIVSGDYPAKNSLEISFANDFVNVSIDGDSQAYSCE